MDRDMRRHTPKVIDIGSRPLSPRNRNVGSRFVRGLGFFFSSMVGKGLWFEVSAAVVLYLGK